jgi:hypothetical protein
MAMAGAYMVALPTIVMSAAMFNGLVAEGHTDWGWFSVMGVAVLVCVVLRLAGFVIRKIGGTLR